MFKTYNNIDDLFSAIDADKNIEGVNADTANRFPVRFVLFDNFKDSYEFISKMSYEKNIQIQSVDNWMDPSQDDIFISHVELSNNIIKYIENCDGMDCVITPFSELARFYDNEEYKEFDSIISTLKAVQSTNSAHAQKQRIYIVIVGQYGKISNFEKDPQIFIWYLQTKDLQINYRLVLVNGTDYKVPNIQSKYTVVHNLREWLYLWRNGADIKNTIISTSQSIYAYGQNALPDNAFSFEKCENIYDFLTLGLGLSFGQVHYKERDDIYWKTLATKIDISNFSFSEFLKRYFQLFEFKNYKNFMKAWHETKDDFDKWLLVTYYLSEFDETDYLHTVLCQCSKYNDKEIFEQLMLAIFEFEDFSKYVDVRTELLNALKYNGSLSIDAQDIFKERLMKMANNYGWKVATTILTSYSNIEKEIAIEWLGKGYISIQDLGNNFRDVSCYLQNTILQIESQSWLNEYFDKYKHAKFANEYSEEIAGILKEHNSSDVDFYKWYQDFKTVYTILGGRKDIKEFYWIDGLGVDWIPVIRDIIESKKVNGIYLNEVKIGKALLPTTTSKNKNDLENLVPNLEKTGDVDLLAHKTNNKYPQYIVEEFEVIRKTINVILDNYANKKIAIISDHGLTYLSQFCEGLNFAGFESHHRGRYAIKKSAEITHKSDKYLALKDSHIICALTHQSLCDKIPQGQGAHGGATPEEVLVPIFIISPQETKITWNAKLKSTDIILTNPIVKFIITGIEKEIPTVIYNGKTYKLNSYGNDEYYSERITFVPDNKKITLCVGSTKKEYELNINFGVEEDDFDL